MLQCSSLITRTLFNILPALLLANIRSASFSVLVPSSCTWLRLRALQSALPFSSKRTVCSHDRGKHPPARAAYDSWSSSHSSRQQCAPNPNPPVVIAADLFPGKLRWIWSTSWRHCSLSSSRTREWSSSLCLVWVRDSPTLLMSGARVQVAAPAACEECDKQRRDQEKVACRRAGGGRAKCTHGAMRLNLF